MTATITVSRQDLIDAIYCMTHIAGCPHGGHEVMWFGDNDATAEVSTLDWTRHFPTASSLSTLAFITDTDEGGTIYSYTHHEHDLFFVSSHWNTIANSLGLDPDEIDYPEWEDIPDEIQELVDRDDENLARSWIEENLLDQVDGHQIIYI